MSRRIAATVVLLVAGAAAAQPANDECEPGNPELTLGVAVTGSTAEATTTLIISPEDLCGFSGGGSDVFYRFTPAETGFYSVSLCGSDFDTVLSVHAGCPLGGGELIICNDDAAEPCADFESLSSRIDSVPLTGGQAYVIRVAGYTDGVEYTESGAYTVVVEAAPSPAPGDTCHTAFTLSGASASGTTAEAAAGPASDCGINDLHDVWYALTIGEAGVYTLSTSGSAIDTTLAVYDGCGGRSVGCNDNAGAEDLTSLLSVVLQPGAYYVRVAGNDDAQGAFSLSVAGPAAPLTNDDCAGATPITAPAVVEGDTTLATGSDPGCVYNDSADVWYSLQVPLRAAYYLDTLGSGMDASIGVYDFCGGSARYCTNPFVRPPGGRSLIVLDPGVYLVRVAGYGNARGGFTLNVSAPVAPPANDECDAPTPIALGGNTGSTIAAGGFDETLGCGENDPVDVWFTFQANQDGVYVFDTVGSMGLTDTTLAAYAACQPQGTLVPLVCNDDIEPQPFDGVTLSRIWVPMEAGQTVLLRVAGVNGATGDFVLNAAGPGPAIEAPANDECAGAAALTPGATLSVDARRAGSEPDVTCNRDTIFELAYGTWYRFVAAEAGTAVFRETSANDVVIAPYQGGCGELTPFVEPEFNTPICGGFLDSVDLALEAGQAVYYLVGSYDASAPALDLAFAFEFEPAAPPCRADFDNQNGVQVADIFAFLRAWFAGSASADFDQMNGIQVADIFAFLRAWFAGC